MHEAGSQKQSPTSDHPKPPSPQDAGPSLCWGQAQSRAGEGCTGLKAECLDFTKGNFDWGTERWFRGEELGRGLEMEGGGSPAQMQTGYCFHDRRRCPSGLPTLTVCATPCNQALVSCLCTRLASQRRLRANSPEGSSEKGAQAEPGAALRSGGQQRAWGLY